MKKSDRYLKIVNWSEEDGCYVGLAPGLFYGGVHGGDEAEVYRRLCEAVDDVIAVYEQDGAPLPPPTADPHYSFAENLAAQARDRRRVAGEKRA
jgi:predicted RNase H-like HicB family nuclease